MNSISKLDEDEEASTLHVQKIKERSRKVQQKSGRRSGSSRTNKKRNDNEKQTLKIGFFICIGKSNQANVKTPTRHMHNIKPTQRHPADSPLPTARRAAGQCGSLCC